MNDRIFTVYDSKIEAFMSPFYSRTMQQALRSFTDTCKSADHAFNKHPEDYTLFELGSFDDNTAKFEIHETPISIAIAIEVIGSETL